MEDSHFKKKMEDSHSYSSQDSTYWSKENHIDQCNNTESPEINPNNINILIFIHINKIPHIPNQTLQNKIKYR